MSWLLKHIRALAASSADLLLIHYATNHKTVKIGGWALALDNTNTALLTSCRAIYTHTRHSISAMVIVNMCAIMVMK